MICVVLFSRAAWTRRGELTESRSNLPLIKEVLQLRVEMAEMHGYPSFAHYFTADTMAGSPDAVQDLLQVIYLWLVG